MKHGANRFEKRDDVQAYLPPCVTFRRVAVSFRGPGQSPVPPFACCVGSLLSDGRGGLCSLPVPRH